MEIDRENVTKIMAVVYQQTQECVEKESVRSVVRDDPRAREEASRDALRSAGFLAGIGLLADAMGIEETDLKKTVSEEDIQEVLNRLIEKTKQKEELRRQSALSKVSNLLSDLKSGQKSDCFLAENSLI